MYLVYFDEFGNTGTNLNDSEQPVFVLCALAVPKTKWLQEVLAWITAEGKKKRPGTMS
jgi:hypothetical protein